MSDGTFDKEFVYERSVAFHETDLMQVVHHSNYLRYFEEARVAWMKARDLAGTHYPHSNLCLGVLSSQVWYHRPAYFDDRLRIHVWARREGVKVRFRYGIRSERWPDWVTTGETLHTSLNNEFKPVKPHPKLIKSLEKEIWIETSPWNS